MQEELLAEPKVKWFARGLGFAVQVELRDEPPARHSTPFRAKHSFLRHVTGNHEAARMPSPWLCK